MNLNLKQKEETGDSLLAVDFQQLQIENAQFLERIDTKNKELINAKMKSGKFRVKKIITPTLSEGISWEYLTVSKFQDLKNGPYL